MFLFILKLSACLAIFYLAYLLLFRNDTNFHLHRTFLLFIMGLSILSAFNNYSLRTYTATPQQISYQTPALSSGKVEITQTPSIQISGRKQTSTTASDSKNLSDYTFLLNWLYFSVTALLLIRILAGFTKLLLLLNTSERINIFNTRVYLSNKISGSTNIFGFIFLNPGLQSDPKLSQIILHENIHASQYHSIDILLVELLAAAMWFNPVVWLMRRSLQQIHEYLADEGVLRSGVNRLEYQELLINHIAEDSLVLSSGFNSSIKKRFFMMTKTNAPRQTKSKILILLPMTAILIAGMSMINAPAQEKQPAKQVTQAKVLPPKAPVANNTKPVIAKADPQKPQPSVKFDKPDVEEKVEIQQEPPVAAVSLTRMNVLYIGVDNPVTIAVANYNPKDIRVSFDNGNFEKADDGYYNYIARPKNTGTATLSIFAGSKLIDKAVFRVKIVPDPVAKVAGRKGGEIAKDNLAAQDEVHAVLENFDFDLHFKITEFTLSVAKDGKSIDLHSNSNKITEEQKDLIRNTNQDQKVYFLDIRCAGPDGHERELLPVVFKIQ